MNSYRLSNPTYLGVKLDRSLTFRHHLVALRKKTIFARHTAETTNRLKMRCWCQNTAHSCSVSALFNSGVYSASVWCCSAHTRLIDIVLNDALHVVTACLRPTPTDHLPILSGIQLAPFSNAPDPQYEEVSLTDRRIFFLMANAFC